MAFLKVEWMTTKKMKKIVINRIFKGDKYTIGKLSIDGLYVCDTIEDKVRADGVKIHGETAIPIGVYLGDVFFSRKFGYNVVRIFGVPMFEGIYIHKGNTEKDSLGCIIVGYNDKKGWVSRPTEAMDKIIKILGDHKFTIEIK